MASDSTSCARGRRATDDNNDEGGVMALYDVKAEMTGSVWKIVTVVGQTIAPGEPVMILESMKMEIPVIAEDGGTVKEILVTEGSSVSEGQVVARLDA